MRDERLLLWTPKLMIVPEVFDVKKIVHCALLPPVTSYCRIYWPLSDHEQEYRHCNPQTLPVSHQYPNLHTSEGITE